MKQKLFLAVTLMHSPDVLLLDEPTTGVDPVSRREFWRILAGLHRAGTTVLVATPYMDEAERCSDVAFLTRRILQRGTPAEIKALVPGRLVEVSATHPRAALAAVQGVPGVRVRPPARRRGAGALVRFRRTRTRTGCSPDRSRGGRCGHPRGGARHGNRVRVPGRTAGTKGTVPFRFTAADAGSTKP